MVINFANKLEKISRRIKKKIQKKTLESFLKKYSLIEAEQNTKSDIRFNPYEGTNLLLIDELINSGVIGTEDKILDVGCGSGIFIIYLYEHGFINLAGVEINADLFELCKENMRKYFQVKNMTCNIETACENALEMRIDDDTNCFYLFNTFYDQNTYAAWLSKVEQSLERKKRDLKIIILFPTVASMAAMRNCNWLYEGERIVCKAQKCYQCMNFIVYRNKE